MPKYRHQLPQLSGRLFLTDGGLETTLIFHDGVDLPHFASFDLLRTAAGVARLRDYYVRYIAIAKRSGTGFVLEGVTWRANPDWAEKLGYSREDLAVANRAAVDLIVALRDVHESEQTPIVISANIGPRGDGYKIDKAMTAAEAEDYHSWQVSIFRDTEADLVSAFTINYAEEGIGVVRACRKAGIPSVISFTVETDGKLPSGQAIQDAIEQTDRETAHAPAYYMLNCAHPTHFADALRKGDAWNDCVACGQTRQCAATRNLTPQRILMSEIQPISAAAIAPCAGSSSISPCSAAVAEPTTAMSNKFRSPACRSMLERA